MKTILKKNTLHEINMHVDILFFRAFFSGECRDPLAFCVVLLQIRYC